MDWRIYLYKYMKHIYDMRQYNINKINTYKKVTSNPTKKTDTCPHHTCDKLGATSVFVKCPTSIHRCAPCAYTC